MANYISSIEINGVVYEIKDTVARQGGIKFILSTDAATTPKGVTWGDPAITGTLEAADADKAAFYLVPADNQGSSNIYHEYIVVTSGSTSVWEQLGDTEIDLSGVVTEVTLNKGAGDSVLGADTTFNTAASAVTFSGGETASVVTDVTPTSSHLVTDTITGVGGSESITPVSSSTDVSIPNVTLGAAQAASHITTENKTATNTVFGTAINVNKVSAGTAKDVASAGTAVTQVLAGDVSQVFTQAQVVNEVLSFTTVSVTKNSITPAVANGTITPITIGDAVAVPQVTSNAEVAISSVKTNTSVDVPDVSLGTPIAASKVVLGAAVSLAKPATTAKTFATGAVANTGAGDEIVTDVTVPAANKATVVKSIGTATAAAQTITVGTNDQVTVAKHGDLSLTVTKHD